LTALELADNGQASPDWNLRVRELSVLCEKAPKTHIAFLGTVLLAKATDPTVDVFALKVNAGTPGAYSARNLAKEVLAPLCRDHHVHIGVTGREPLNNQPYFRESRASRQMPVRPNARPVLNKVCDLLDELDPIKDRSELLKALASFITVRRASWPSAKPYVSQETVLKLAGLIRRIEEFVQADSEGGRRAQAVATGLMDVLEGTGNVETSRVNDPDRKFPGDVAVRTSDSDLTRVLEVRDKSVGLADLGAFVAKATSAGVARAGVLAVAPHQEPLDVGVVQRAAAEHGLALEVFLGWAGYLHQLVFWMPSDIQFPIEEAHHRIYERVVELECSQVGQDLWLRQDPSSNSSA
jgi:SacI restriction endonuclease